MKLHIKGSTAENDFGTTLVTNSHLARTISASAGDSPSGRLGQRFTTGANSEGFVISSIGMYIGSIDHET